MKATPPLYSRHDSLDLLRGIAVLGILLCNIWSFALPYPAYDNPAAFGDLTGWNYWAWWLPAVFAQEKFITLFSLMFGAGMALFCEHLDRAGTPAAFIHYRRMLTLMLFGVLHAYLLWYGDILAVYAACGMLLYPLLRCSTRWLLLIIVLLFALEFLLLWSLTSTLRALPAEQLLLNQQDWLPSSAQLADEVAIYRGGWAIQMQHRVSEAWAGEWATLFFYGPRLSAQMLLGVLLYRSAWLLAKAEPRQYWLAAIVLLGSGLTMVVIGVERFADAGFSFDASLLMGNYWNAAGSLLVALGYAALVMCWSQRPDPGLLRQALIRTGRMAFSNYLLTTLICTTLFYGHGFALFGQIERAGLLLICLLIWLVLIVCSQYWLRDHPQGPLEWLWRWVSYGKRPAWRAAVPATPAS